MTERERSLPPTDWVDTTAGGQESYGEGVPETADRHVPPRDIVTGAPVETDDDHASVEQSDLGGVGLGDDRGPGAGLGETRAGDAGGGMGVRSIQ